MAEPITEIIVYDPSLDITKAVQTPEDGLYYLLWVGYNNMDRHPTMPDLQYDEETEIGETGIEYSRRTLDMVDKQHQARALTEGLTRAERVNKLLNNGIQYALAWSYFSGRWVYEVEDYAGGTENELAFRRYVRSVLQASDEEGTTPTEATHLATTIFNLHWLHVNEYIKVDPLTIFADRKKYTKWRRGAARIRALIEADEETPEPNSPYEAQIEKMVEAIQSEETTHAQIDELASQKPKVEPAVFEQREGVDNLGRNVFTVRLTRAQQAVLRSLLKRVSKWVLQGEVVESNSVLVRYRQDLDPETGEILKETYQAWHPETGWTRWEEMDEPAEMNGRLSGTVIEDVDRRYWAQWE